MPSSNLVPKMTLELVLSKESWQACASYYEVPLDQCNIELMGRWVMRELRAAVSRELARDSS